MNVMLIKDNSERYEWTVLAEGEQGFHGMLDTEDVRDLMAYNVHDLLRLRFHRLSFGHGGDDAHQIVDMELIWLVALIKAGYSITRHMIEALSEDFVWSTSPKPHSDWDTFEWVGREIGIDFMIDAYLEGVPLEHVLADVEFLPDYDVSHSWRPSNLASLANLGPITSINFGNVQPIVYPSYTQEIANYLNKQVMSLGA